MSRFIRAVGAAPVIADQLEGPPQGSGWTKWIGGVFFALLPGIGGIVAITRGRIAVGAFFISLGLFVHFHYFWGLHPKLCALSGLGKNVAALGMIVPILYGFYYFFFRM
jgi:hypothetical protein